MSALAFEPITPDQAAVSKAHRALPHIEEYLANHETQESLRLLVDDEPLEVPRTAVELLARILAHIATGQGVYIVSAHAELTTQQAADLLNVSRPFLIGLLNAGEIEYRTVGRHRRVKAESLREYMRDDDAKRRQAAAELSALNQETGLI
ncbi:helix-turn-helix domain-containing protein [Actinocrispum sp. NPDC049592]|uniref:helix-turn-helix domain-containing protein n=1 Tax=Actinocrispum sp. NPDC049592 TaxID=3154835 RepID=UPI0034290B34